MTHTVAPHLQRASDNVAKAGREYGRMRRHQTILSDALLYETSDKVRERTLCNLQVFGREPTMVINVLKAHWKVYRVIRKEAPRTPYPHGYGSMILSALIGEKRRLRIRKIAEKFSHQSYRQAEE